MTFAIGPRNLLLQQPAEVREANIDAIPDPAERAARRSVIERGVEAPEFAGALAKMVAFLDQVEAAITPGGWLSGDSFGLADAAALPYVLRLDHLAMGPLLSADARPALADWYAACAGAPVLRDRRGELGTRVCGGNPPHERTGGLAAGRGFGEVERGGTIRCHTYGRSQERPSISSSPSSRWPSR